MSKIMRALRLRTWLTAGVTSPHCSSCSMCRASKLHTPMARSVPLRCSSSMTSQLCRRSSTISAAVWPWLSGAWIRYRSRYGVRSRLSVLPFRKVKYCSSV